MLEPSRCSSLLLVDDDDEARELVASALRQRGHGVSCAANGQEAVELLRTSRSDLVILDLEMPQMNGRQFLAGRSSDWLDIPVVILTASEQLTDLHGTTGVVAILKKPCELSRLLVTIDAVLRAQT
jgi:two-component system OmpR family response regulator